ncbi:hypothetical protein AC249_AIPGENE6047, partial [Exaiptasia diaphana]
GLRGLWLWVITIFSFGLFLRGEEPLRLKVKHLKLPRNYNINSGKIPMRIDVKIPWSKADRKAKGVSLTLWANPIHHDLCPVRALIAWLFVSGVRKGYIFPRIKKNNLGVCNRSCHGVHNYRRRFSEA